MLACVFSCAMIDHEGLIVEVEVDRIQGLPGTDILDLPDKAHLDDFTSSPKHITRQASHSPDGLVPEISTHFLGCPGSRETNFFGNLGIFGSNIFTEKYKWCRPSCWIALEMPFVTQSDVHRRMDNVPLMWIEINEYILLSLHVFSCIVRTVLSTW
jgi:hypothetical protein